MMATGRFRSPKTKEEEIALLSETVSKNTKCNTKWAVNDFTTWQNMRMNKKAQLETVGRNGLERTDVVEDRVYLGVRTCEVFLCFVTVMFVLSIVLTSLFSLFYVTREGNRFLHRG